MRNAPAAATEPVLRKEAVGRNEDFKGGDDGQEHHQTDNAFA